MSSRLTTTGHKVNLSTSFFLEKFLGRDRRFHLNNNQHRSLNIDLLCPRKVQIKQPTPHLHLIWLSRIHQLFGSAHVYIFDSRCLQFSGQVKV